MRKIIVSASFGGKIPTGSYQNMNPSFYASEEVELGDEYKEKDVVEYIKLRQQILEAICYSNFEAEAIKAKVLKVQADRKDFRWYKLPSGQEVPSVTSILGFDTEYFIDDDELRQYAAQGTIIHAQVAEFIKSGQWKALKDIPGIGAELFILKTGKLDLAQDGWDFPGFLKKYALTNLKGGRSLLNEQTEYGGEFDLEGLFAEEGDPMPTLCDVKRTPDKVKNFQQLAAYAKCSGMEHIKQLMIIGLNDKNKCGYEKPIITREIDRYYELFLAKRKDFKRVYGI